MVVGCWKFVVGCLLFVVVVIVVVVVVVVVVVIVVVVVVSFFPRRRGARNSVKLSSSCSASLAIPRRSAGVNMGQPWSTQHSNSSHGPSEPGSFRTPC